MNKCIVIKDNTLINSSYFLTLTEKRLILYCIAKAQKENRKINNQDFIEISANDFNNFYKFNENNDYRNLKSACDQLMKRIFSYEYLNSKEKKVIRKSHWVNKIDYIELDATVKILFSDEIIPFISELEKNFTKYFLKDVAKMTSVYAIRLYELIIAWGSVGKTPVIELSEFRKKLGILDNEYPRMTNFKDRVLNVALKQINELSNIKVEIEQHKKGRSIYGFSFQFIEKKEKDVEKKAIKTLSDSQRHLFAKKLSEMPEMSKYSQGTESYQQFAIRIADMLADQNKLIEFTPLLEKAGYEAH